jgi:predicted transcriptional regulator
MPTDRRLSTIHHLPRVQDGERTMSDIESKLSDLQLKVYDQVRLAGWDGKTTDEIEATLGLTHQSVSARVNELKNWKPDPLIERRGVTRKTRAGRPADVYVLAGLRAATERK